MATAQQIKSLLQSHYTDDEDKFTSIALQLAAHEARLGNINYAREIKALIDKSKTGHFKVIKLKKEISDLVLIYYPEDRINDLVLKKEVKEKLLRIIREYQLRNKLHKHGLENRRKILLAGHPGTGKTITVSALASELKIPMYVVMMDKLMTKYMGETSSKLRQIFDMMNTNRGVYLFDEFDAIGAERARENEVGEMRRVLNSFLQFIEQDKSESLIFCATNSIKILDSALFRRFDDIINYDLPDESAIKQLIQLKLHKYIKNNLSLDNIVAKAKGLSHAEITNACNDALKEIILNNLEFIGEDLLVKMLKDRKANY